MMEAKTAGIRAVEGGRKWLMFFLQPGFPATDFSAGRGHPFHVVVVVPFWSRWGGLMRTGQAFSHPSSFPPLPHCRGASVKDDAHTRDPATRHSRAPPPPPRANTLFLFFVSALRPLKPPNPPNPPNRNPPDRNTPSLNLPNRKTQNTPNRNVKHPEP